MGMELCEAAGGEPRPALCSSLPCRCFPRALAAITWVSPLEPRAWGGSRSGGVPGACLAPRT